MTNEEKQLLLIDLCARLPYGVMIEITTDDGIMEVSYDMRLDAGLLADLLHCEDDFKPYLRPMSSMTEEEIKTYRTLQDTACSYHYEFGDIVDDFLYFDNDASLDYLNSIHIDYRGLIPIGLALEAPERMYKTEYLKRRLQEKARNYQDEKRMSSKEEARDRVEWLAEMERDRRNGAGTD